MNQSAVNAHWLLRRPNRRHNGNGLTPASSRKPKGPNSLDPRFLKKSSGDHDRPQCFEANHHDVRWSKNIDVGNFKKTTK